MMRARNRHSASNYLFAAFLEMVIMAIFVIIAQPQLRESLFEMLEPSARTLAEPESKNGSAAVDGQSGFGGAQYATGDNAAATHAVQGYPAQGHAVQAQPVHWSPTSASHTPFEQFESFAVSTGGSPLPVTPASVTAETRVAGYVPSPGATQLSVIDWNIASAAQSPRPLSGWTAPRPVETQYRETYPPPYGTQSQWK